jgi:hypothetical protein
LHGEVATSCRAGVLQWFLAALLKLYAIAVAAATAAGAAELYAAECVSGVIPRSNPAKVQPGSTRMSADEQQQQQRGSSSGSSCGILQLAEVLSHVLNLAVMCSRSRSSSTPAANHAETHYVSHGMCYLWR